MALNWQHIKGVYGTGVALVYKYLEFSADPAETPKIYIGDKNVSDPVKSGLKDWGNILTSSGAAQIITKPLYFNNTSTVQIACKLYDNNQIDFGTSTKDTYIKYDLNESALSINSATTIALKATNIFFDGLGDNSLVTFKKAINFKDNLTLESGKALVCGDSTKINKDFIQAPYFNATSDKRAKTNIQPFHGSALDIINKLQTYTYNYTNSKIKSYGLMAQDLLDVDLNGFSFVDNKTATGENNDYMTIRESKLVYLLIEAVKEQQTQINELKQKLEELTNGK